MGIRGPALAGFLALAAGTALFARELKPATLAAFDRYVRLTEARMADEVEGRSPFLWIDRRPAPEDSALRARLARGEIITARLETRESGKRIDAPGGLIHHWIGTVLLPGVSLDRAIAFVQNYPGYPTAFAPLIVRARVVSQTPDLFVVTMRTRMEKVIEVVMDGDYTVEYRRLSNSRVYTRSVASNLFQVDDAGKPGETRTPGDQATGFLWRINTYCWFQSAAEGTYEQCEAISLTRDAPMLLGPIVRPFITGIPRDALTMTLTGVRKGVGK